MAKIRIYSMTTDDDNGLVTSLFTNQQKLFAAMWDYMRLYHGDDKHFAALRLAHNDQIYEVWLEVRMNLDTLTDDMHDLEINVP